MKSDEDKLKESNCEDKKEEMDLDSGVKKVDTSSSDATAADSTKEEGEKEDGETKEVEKEVEKSDEKKIEKEDEKMNGKDNKAEEKEDGEKESEKEEGEAEEGETKDTETKEEEQDKEDKSKSETMDTSLDKEKQANEKEKDKPEKAEEKEKKPPPQQDSNIEEKKDEKAMEIEQSSTKSDSEDKSNNGSEPIRNGKTSPQTTTSTVDSSLKETTNTDNIATTATNNSNNNDNDNNDNNSNNNNNNNISKNNKDGDNDEENSNNSNSNNINNINNIDNNGNSSNNNQTTDRPAETEPYEEVDQKKIEEELKEKREHMADNIVISANGTNGVSANGSGDDDEEMEEEYESAFAKNQESAISKSSYSSNKEADIETKKRLECLGNMERIEKEFTDLKEKFFNDKLTQIKKEIEEIKLGEHLSFQERIRELELKKERKIAIAENWKKYQIQSILNMYDAECKQYEDEHNEEATHLRERMVSTLSERQKRISEEKESMRMNDGEARITTRTRRRTQQPTQPQSVALKKKQNPPSIVYSLKENEIMDDYNIIFKSRR